MLKCFHCIHFSPTDIRCKTPPGDRVNPATETFKQGEGGNQGFIHELLGARRLTPGGTPVSLDHHLLFIHIFINQSMSAFQHMRMS